MICRSSFFILFREVSPDPILIHVDIHLFVYSPCVKDFHRDVFNYLFNYLRMDLVVLILDIFLSLECTSFLVCLAFFIPEDSSTDPLTLGNEQCFHSLENYADPRSTTPR